MTAQVKPPVPQVKQTPGAMHRRQMLWQVWTPLIVTLVIVLALMVLAIIGTVQGSAQVNRWGNISAVLVIIPVLVSGLLVLVIFAAMAYGVSKLVKNMPGWLLKVQLFMLHLALIVRRVADTATKPVFTANSFTARASRLWEKIFHRKRTIIRQP
jgi:hypothetical protein